MADTNTDSLTKVVLDTIIFVAKNRYDTERCICRKGVTVELDLCVEDALTYSRKSQQSDNGERVVTTTSGSSNKELWTETINACIDDKI